MSARTAFKIGMLTVLVSLACSLVGGETPTSPPGTETPTVEPTSEPEPPPTDFEAVLEEEVAAGQVTYEDGLIRLLHAFLGDPEAALPDAYDEAVTTEGTGIVERANDYIAGGPDEGARAEMQRLLDLLIPTTEHLQAYGRPATAQRASPGLARPPAQIDCASLWRAGFPLAGVERYPCFEYTIDSVPGIGAYGIYYPASWEPGHPGRAKLQATADAAHDSLTAYGVYGDVGPINIIFSLWESPAGFLADVSSRHPGATEVCPVLIYPAAFDLDQGEFKQIVAHELFHCFQLQNLQPQLLGTERPVRKWWSEASAEYFSNVVYNDVNYEFRFTYEFDDLSPATPLTQMGYENFIFFQDLGNRVGDREVIEFLRTMPTSGGGPEQLAALAAWPDMQDLFHDFGRAYLDGEISDTGGGTIPGSPNPGTTVVFPAASGSGLPARPFVLQRYAVTFDPDLRYALTTTASGPEGLNGFRLGLGEGALGPVPEILNTACPAQPATLLVTTANDATTPHELRIQTETEDAGECDRCLFGTWQLDLESYRQAYYIMAPTFGESAGTINEVSGAVQMTISEVGRVEGTIDGLFVSLTVPIGDEPTLIEMRTSGTSTSVLVVESEGRLTTLRPVEAIQTEFHVERAGVAIDLPFAAPPSPTSLSGAYTCSGDTLHIIPLGVGAAHPGLTYNRLR